MTGATDHLPDWGQPTDAGGVLGYLAQGAARVLVLPDALVLATGPDGRPEFRLSAVRPVMPTASQPGYGRLELRLALRSAAALPDGRVQAAPALRGWLVLGARALDLPPELQAPLELRCSGIGAADLSLPLHAESVGFVERALAEGALPVLARADLEVAGLARRVPGRLTVDHARLAAFLADGVSRDAVRQALATDPVALGVRIDSADPLAVEAATDHLCARMAGGPMRPTAEGLVLVWDERIARSGQSGFDLSQAVLATRVVQLVLDPFAEARRLAGGPSLVRRVTTSPLQAGQHRVRLSANLPRPLVGPLAVGARLVFPARPPARTHEVREDVAFADDAPVDRVVRLSPSEPLAWQVEATVWLPTPDGRGAALVLGPRIDGTGPEIELSPQDFPLSITRIAASDAVLALGQVELVAGAAGVLARLMAGTPEVAIALPGPGSVAARVVAPDGQALELAPRDGDRRIELADLAGYGPRVTEISVDFPAGLFLRALDLQVGDGPVQVLAFTPARPVRRFDWFCANPFLPGLTWRWHDGGNDFAPVSSDRLTLHASEGVVA